MDKHLWEQGEAGFQDLRRSKQKIIGKGQDNKV